MSRAQALSRLIDTARDARVMFQTIFEPFLFGFKSDQHASRFAVTRDDDLMRLRLAKIAGQIVLEFGERDFLHSGFPNCASHRLGLRFGHDRQDLDGRAGNIVEYPDRAARRRLHSEVSAFLMRPVAKSRKARIFKGSAPRAA